MILVKASQNNCEVKKEKETISKIPSTKLHSTKKITDKIL